MIFIILWLGKYRILSALDSLSSNPHVFLAEHIRLRERRVIKKISKTHPFFEQLKKEAEFLSEYSSEFTPKLYDVEEDDENLYLVEEFIEGVSLSSDKFQISKKDEKKVLNIIFNLFNFLKHINSMNETILYIDWKPGNIIVNGTELKVVDFGSVIFLERNQEFTELATDGFAAPELKNGEKIGTHTDIYGFGSIVKILAEKLENKRTLFGNTVREKLIKLSVKCTGQNADKRIKLKDIEKILKKMSKSKFTKSYEDKRIITLTDRDAKLIGICGNERGVGTTHISYLIAENLFKAGRKVAHVSFGKASEGFDYLHLKAKKKINFYNDILEEEVARLLNSNYDNIIIDFGKIEEEFPLLFLSCNEKNIVVQNNVIKGGRISEFMRLHREFINSNGWKILVNLSDEKALKTMKIFLRQEKINVDCIAVKTERIQ